MNFPGDNELTISAEALKELILAHVPMLVGTSARITSIELRGYSRQTLEIKFTTDPLPALVEVPKTEAA